MKVLKLIVGEKKWIEITMQEAIDLCEGAGYWKEGTVEGILMEGHTIRTPWSFFKIKKLT
jgi:hypothetical protein